MRLEAILGRCFARGWMQFGVLMRGPHAPDCHSAESFPERLETNNFNSRFCQMDEGFLVLGIGHVPEQVWWRMLARESCNAFAAKIDQIMLKHYHASFQLPIKLELHAISFEAKLRWIEWLKLGVLCEHAELQQWFSRSAMTILPFKAVARCNCRTLQAKLSQSRKACCAEGFVSSLQTFQNSRAQLCDSSEIDIFQEGWKPCYEIWTPGDLEILGQKHPLQSAQQTVAIAPYFLLSMWFLHVHSVHPADVLEGLVAEKATCHGNVLQFNSSFFDLLDCAHCRLGRSCRQQFFSCRWYDAKAKMMKSFPAPRVFRK